MRTTQKKGDRAVAQAVATFTKLGGDVLFPLTESAAYDLVVDFYDELKRIQVRFSSDKEVGLRRIHSNSKGYVVKRPRKNAYDWLYVLNADGKEYLITRDLTGRNSVTPQSKDLLENVFPDLEERWQSGLTHRT
ncbi:MAG: group I intron-associated PD-(D/E)XK endonuclease [Patescibacteria group bacterium]